MGQAPDELMSREDLPPLGGGMPPDEQDNPSIPELRGEIAQTRAEMSGTLNALEERLSPEALVEEAKAKVRSEAEEGLDRARELFRGYVQLPVEQGMRQAGNGVALVSAQAQQLADEMPAYLRAWQEELARQSTRLVVRARQLQQENPVAFGVVLAGIGTGLGVAALLLARALNRVGDS